MRQFSSLFFLTLTLFTVTACSDDVSETPPDDSATMAGEWTMLVFDDDDATYTRGEDPGVVGRTELSAVDAATWGLNVELVKLEGGNPTGSVDALSIELVVEGDHLILDDGLAFLTKLDGEQLTFTLDVDHPKTLRGDGPQHMVFERATALRTRLAGEYDIVRIDEGGATMNAGDCIALPGDPPAMRSTHTFDISPRLVTSGVEETIFYEDAACTQELSRETSETEGLLVDDGSVVDLYVIPESDDRGDHNRFEVTRAEDGTLILDRADCATSCDGPMQLVLEPRD